MRTFTAKQTPIPRTKSARPAAAGPPGRQHAAHSPFYLERALARDVAPPERRGDASAAGGAMRTETTVARYPFQATIRRAPSASTTGSATLAARRSDSERGAGDGGGTDAALAALLGASDVDDAALAELGRDDVIVAGIGYSGSITRGGAAPSGFGVTRSFGSNLTGVTITPATGLFAVAATLEHPITYQIRSGTGPGGQVDIASETDGDITRANYATVASDLTPNMTDLNGRPPRTQFWAEDLTVRHERVHASDDNANGPLATLLAMTWLNTQSAANIGEVNTLLGRVPQRFAAALLAALSTEDGEKHAYGDGAPSYLARADAIRAKGGRGEYP